MQTSPCGLVLELATLGGLWFDPNNGEFILTSVKTTDLYEYLFANDIGQYERNITFRINEWTILRPGLDGISSDRREVIVW